MGGPPKWTLYRLPITSDYPPDCPYQLEHIVGQTDENKTLRARFQVAPIGAVLPTPCSCGGMFRLEKVQLSADRSLLRYRCADCFHKIKADQKTGKPLEEA